MTNARNVLVEIGATRYSRDEQADHTGGCAARTTGLLAHR